MTYFYLGTAGFGTLGGVLSTFFYLLFAFDV